MRDGDRVYDPLLPGHYWEYHSLVWWARAETGSDFWGCRIISVVDGDRLRVRHGEGGEAVRWFTADELNHVGTSWYDGSPVHRWFEEIHRYLGEGDG